jgi:hypothetical protein
MARRCAEEHGGESLRLRPRHPRVIETSLRDQTDHHGEQVHTIEWLLWSNESPFDIRGCVLAAEDPQDRSGTLFSNSRRCRKHGMKFGLWFGPDSSNDAANRQKDADHSGKCGDDPIAPARCRTDTVFHREHPGQTRPPAGEGGMKLRLEMTKDPARIDGRAM